jgi:hypothetical protein
VTLRERLVLLAGLAALAFVLGWAWTAYFSPAMLIDLANLRLCL